tara:strand:+ start:14060 stop:16027 length:1968 start_codon:yes stop_codon:yes gene_type:complete
LNAQNKKDEIIISASKLSSNKPTGLNLITITKEDLLMYADDSLPKILSRVPGIQLKSLYGNGFGNGDTLDMRSFGDAAPSNTLILLNGQRLSNIDNSFVDFTTFSLENIERIEILKGNSSTVLYGGNSTGGSINIITNKFPIDIDSATIKQSVGHYGKQHSYLSVNKTFKEKSFHIDSNFFKDDGYRENSEFNSKNISFQLNGLIKENLAYHFNIGVDTKDNGLPGALSSSTWLTDPRSTTTPQDFNTSDGIKLFIGTIYEINSNLEVESDFGYKFNHTNAFYFSSYGASYNSSIDTKNHVFTFNPRIKFSNRFLNYKLNSMIGFDGRYTYYDSERANLDGKKNFAIYKFNDFNTGLYANTDLDLNNSQKVGFGIRLQGNWLKATDSVDTSAGTPNKGADNESSLTYEPQLAFHLGFEQKIENYGVFFARLGKSFRYPNVDERLAFKGYGVSTTMQLNSQRSFDFEFGHNYKNSFLEFNTAFYYMLLRGEIYYRSKEYVNLNLAASKRFGSETSINIKLSDSLYINNSFTAQIAKLREGPNKGHEIPGNANFSSNSEIRYKFSNELSLFLNVYYEGRKRRINTLNNFQVKQKAYHHMNLGLKGKALEFDYSITANNLLNKKIYNYSVAADSGTYGTYNVYPLPEFNLMMKISKTF